VSNIFEITIDLDSGEREIALPVLEITIDLDDGLREVELK
jgi:hypothetical protein